MGRPGGAGGPLDPFQGPADPVALHLPNQLDPPQLGSVLLNHQDRVDYPGNPEKQSQEQVRQRLSRFLAE